jgi:hypothetical protein
MAAAYPPGGTFFDTVKKSFVDVPVDESKDNAISTTEFLEAAESLSTLFGTWIQVIGELKTNEYRCAGLSGVQAREERHGWQRQGTRRRSYSFI